MTRFCVAAAAMLLAIAPAFALDGQPAMHDPSTAIEAGGRFYVYATGSSMRAAASHVHSSSCRSRCRDGVAGAPGGGGRGRGRGGA